MPRKQPRRHEVLASTDPGLGGERLGADRKTLAAHTVNVDTLLPSLAPQVLQGESRCVSVVECHFTGGPGLLQAQKDLCSNPSSLGTWAYAPF